MSDTISVLTSTSSDRLATKRWYKPGTEPDKIPAPAFVRVKTEHVSNIQELASLLERIEPDPLTAIVRGRPKQPPAGPIARRHETFEDTPHHWVCFDIDKFKPVLWDAVLEPEGAVSEFIQTRLPAEFQGASHHWQLSASAGKESNRDTLKAHVWFWLDAEWSSAEVQAWARACAPAVDPVVFERIQWHYTAAPVFDVGAPECLVQQRHGFVDGLLGEDVPLRIDPTLVAIAKQRETSDRMLVDPREKPGLIGAFTRAYDPTRVVEELMPDHFEFAPDSDHRITWLTGTGSPEGMCIAGAQGQHIYCGQASDPFNNRAVNTWDFVRVHMFGSLDAGLDESTLAFMGPNGTPSAEAMQKFARDLPDVQVELQEAEAVVLKEKATPEHSHGQDVLSRLAHDLGVEMDAVPFNHKEFDRQMARCAYHSVSSKFRIMVPGGEVLTAVRADLATVLRERFPKIAAAATLEELARARAADKAWNATKTEAFVKDIKGRTYGRLAELVIAHRQFSTISLVVDMFAEDGRFDKDAELLRVIAPHDNLEEGPVDAAIITDYRAHWPGVDDYLSLLVGARFASDRKSAHLWLHAESNWGKNFFLSALDRHGLVRSTSSDDLERALSGAPSGMTMAGMKRVWVLAVDEFKGVTRELKQLSSELTFAPKGEPSVTVPLYLKHFMSAEDVPSLVSAETGVESQFANRFLYMRGLGALTARALFSASPAAYFTSVRNWVGAEINRRVEEYRALGEAGAVARGDAVIREMHGRYRLADAIQGGARSLDDSLEEIAQDFAAEMIAASQAPGRGSSRADAKARDDVFQFRKVYYLKRAAAALDLWLEERFGKTQGAKVRYKSRQILDHLGGLVVVNLPRNECPAGVVRSVKCIVLGAVDDDNTSNVLSE